ncbi:L-threonylcarbamoyladenylate synthase [Nematocida sp. AWRm77]|nr:L-threonylcarbamoyladenylate synthase [Nematocida sp. AWRm77]
MCYTTEIVLLDDHLERIKEAFARSPVAFPTETVYGLGAILWREDLLRKIFEIKNRPSDNPLIVHVSSISMLKTCIEGDIPPQYTEVIEKYWPGPITLLFKKNKNISSLVTGNSPYVAIRMPKHPDALKLIEALGVPIVGPSANKSTRPSPTMPQHVLDDLDGEIPFIIDGGACSQGVESTVVNGLVSPPLLLRPGVVTFEQLREDFPDLSLLESADHASSKGSPGLRYKHYTPRARVVMFTGSKEEQLSKIQAALKETRPHPLKKVGLLLPMDLLEKLPPMDFVEYSLGDTLADAAQNLFNGLRYLDKKVDEIYTVEVSNAREGRAVMDRLSRAASFKI